MESRRNFLRKGEILIGSFIAGSAPGSYQKHKTSNNILEFGAKGDGSDDTLAFKKAIELINKGELSSLYIPSGTYKIDTDICIIRNKCKIYGDGSTSILQPIDIKYAKRNANSTAINIQSNSCIIEDINIQHFYTAIKWNTKQQININRCHISYNTIGIMTIDGYINSISNNYICFNKIGIVSLGKSFQLLIQSNVIDNNISQEIGGIGILLMGSNGCEIRYNTIEGNRNLTNGIGCGIFAVGICSKLNIIGNWFEVNYELGKQDVSLSSDIYFFNKDYVNINAHKKIVSCLILEELMKHLNQSSYGSLNIRDNVFIYTPTNILLTNFNFGRVSITGNTFTGNEAFSNKSIYVTHKENAYYNTTVYIHDNCIQNISGNSNIVNKRMLSGLNGSLLFLDNTTKINGSLNIKNED